MHSAHIHPINGRHLPHNTGSKAANLHWLVRRRLRVPHTHVLTWDAYERYLSDDVGLVKEMQAALESTIDPDKKYAVRSSSNHEDASQDSYAGQFKSKLNCQGKDNILQAIWSIWSSARTEKVTSYLSTKDHIYDDLRMAVLIQEMVDPFISGVVFSHNPTTGKEEITIEAAFGSGEAIMNDGCTPQRAIWCQGRWTCNELAGVLPEAIQKEIIKTVQRLVKKRETGLDLEWVFNGLDLYWVQIREITTIEPVDIYSNTIARDMLPGMIKPLVWSINIPLINTVWVSLLDEAVGPTGIHPESLARSFYFRTYFNMGTFARVFKKLGLPANALEKMMGVSKDDNNKFKMRPTAKTLLLLPRLVRFLFSKAHFGKHIEHNVSQLEADFHDMPAANLSGLSMQDLMTGIEKNYHMTQRIAYYNIVAPLIMFLYNNLLKRHIIRNGRDYELLDLMADHEAIDRFDPKPHLKALNQIFQTFAPDLRDRLLNSSLEDFLSMDGISDFQCAYLAFKALFGHLSDSGNDFSVKPWREDHALLLKMIAGYEDSSSQKDHDQRFRIEDIPMSWITRRMVDPIYQRTRRYRYYREHISSVYTYGYGLFRNYFLAIGDHFVKDNIINEQNDIFFLTWDEIKQITAELPTHADWTNVIQKRKTDMIEYKNIALPSVIYGDETPPIEPLNADKLAGIPTSRGYATATARVVHGIDDFERVQQGEIIVIPYSDVGWTPLILKSCGVVAESGGMLAHCSIIAREGHIPAVVSVDNAMLIPDGTKLTIDGYKGEIILHNNK